jgi:hypothetical protein
MKTLIVLRGNENLGKSETIRKVYNFTIEKYFLSGHVDASVEANLKIINTTAVITVDGVKIGIESVGDRPGLLAKSLRNFDEKRCEAIVCAARPSPSFAVVVNDYKNKGYDVEWIDKVDAGESRSAQQSSNESTAKQIVNRLNKVLTEKGRRQQLS